MKKKPTPCEYKDAEGREVFPDSFGKKKWKNGDFGFMVIKWIVEYIYATLFFLNKKEAKTSKLPGEETNKGTPYT